MGYKGREATAKMSDSQEAEREGERRGAGCLCRNRLLGLSSLCSPSRPYPCSAAETRCLQLASFVAQRPLHCISRLSMVIGSRLARFIFVCAESALEFKYHLLK